MSRVFQVVSIFMLAWFALTWLSGLHVILGTLLFLFALANSVTAWMLRYSPTSLNSVMKFGFGANYIRFVGRWTGDKAPAGEKRERSGILLGEGHEVAARRPDRRTIAALPETDPGRLAAIDAHHIQLLVARAVAFKHDLRPVGGK